MAARRSSRCSDRRQQNEHARHANADKAQTRPDVASAKRGSCPRGRARADRYKTLEERLGVRTTCQSAVLPHPPPAPIWYWYTPHFQKLFTVRQSRGGPWRRSCLQCEQAGRMSDLGGSVRAGRFAPCDRRVLTRLSRRRSLGASPTPAPDVPALRRDDSSQKWFKRPRPQASKSGSNDPVPKHPPSPSGRTSERPARSDGSTGRTAPPETRRSPPRA